MTNSFPDATRRNLEQAADGRPQTMALARLATQLRVAGKLRAAAEALDDAANAAALADDDALSYWFAMRCAEVLEILGDRARALRITDDILVRARNENISLSLADALSMSAALHATVGELLPALEQAAEAVSVLAKMPEQPVTAVVHGNLARTYGIADMDERAVSSLERALRLLEPTEHVHETAVCLANLGGAHVAWALRLLAMAQNDLARERFAVATDPLRARRSSTSRVCPSRLSRDGLAPAWRSLVPRWATLTKQ